MFRAKEIRRLGTSTGPKPRPTHGKRFTAWGTENIYFFIPAITLARNTIKVRADICVQDYTGKNLTTCQHHEFARKL